MSKTSSQYYCKICTKSYKSYSGLWKHNLNYHNETINRINIDNITCKYCKNNFNCKSSRWRHEQKCDKMIPYEKNKINKKINENNEIDQLKNKVDNLQSQITIISSKPNTQIINNNYIIIIIIYSPHF